MARISGVNIPTDKRVVISLTYIFGIGHTHASQICKKADIDESVRVKDLTEETHIEREMLLMKLKCSKTQRDEVKRLTDIFRARIIDVTDTTYTVELTGATEKILAFINSMGKIKIIEMVRSGALGISRGIDSLENIK